MDSKHFSHNHVLVENQVPQGSDNKICCSGCKFPVSGNVFACWQCSFFLHEECFHAARSLNHPSHPLHPLTLAAVPTYPSGSFICSSCSHPGSGFSYSCSACEFDLHLHCARMKVNAANYPNCQNTPHMHTAYPHNPSPPPPPQHQANPALPTYSMVVINTTTTSPPQQPNYPTYLASSTVENTDTTKILNGKTEAQLITDMELKMRAQTWKDILELWD